ncbi:MAG: hypothetical protein K2X64_00075 [Rhodocyclaceae bacterium]|nr:hypothetical protein [Rhodocyclaceae bacterium]
MRTLFPFKPSSLLLHDPRRWLLFGLLIVLHMVLRLGAETPVGRSLLIVHFGLFLLWQPFVGSRLSVARPYLLLFVLLLTVMIGVGQWALILWMILLGGLVGGRVFFKARLPVRIFYLLALTDLVATLLLIAVPALVSAGYDNPFLRNLALYVFPAILGVLMLLLPARDEEGQHAADSIDLIYSVFIMLLLAVLVAGTIALMLLKQLGYFEALLAMLVVMATTLLILSLVWSPRAGFPGLAALVWRYMLAERLPLDKVLRELTELARAEPQPLPFIRKVCLLLPEYLGWVSGGSWRLEAEPKTVNESFGECAGVEHVFLHGPLRLSLYARRSMPPTLVWHARLLVQLIGELVLAKLQAQQLREMSYLQAIHETGARLTHDVKNLLQSLNTLCAAAEREGDTPSPAFQSLMRNQLPVITQRLQLTMGKLQKPVAANMQRQSAAIWWATLCQRFENHGVHMAAQDEALPLDIPLELFESAVENMIQNAFDKRALQPDLNISLRLWVFNGLPTLQVEDDGAALGHELAAQVGVVPTESENGLGIGLYQVGRLAVEAGYRLVLLSNQPGAVCFALQPVGAAA